MFGYVKPFQPELKVKELDAYKAVYCGLCGQMGKSFGPVARLSLSYDFAFLAMLAYGVRGETPSVAVRRCYVNPLKRLPICAGDEALRLSADVATLMLWHKVEDNLRDEGGIASLGWRVVRPFVGRARRRAAGSRTWADEILTDSVGRQGQVEQGKPGVDESCEPTAKALAGIFRELSEEESQRRVLERLGYLTGRFAYLCDALDDLEEDAKRGRFNPFVVRFDLAEESGAWAEARQEAVDSLYMTIGEAEKVFNLLELSDFEPILRNIITMGLRASVDAILANAERRLATKEKDK